MGECDALRRMDHDNVATPNHLPSRNGMVLLDMADEVLDSAATYQRLHQQMTVHVFEGGTIHAPA